MVPEEPIFGDNIGTTITAVLAALGSNIAAKRVAGAHVLFNVIGTVLCLVLLVPFTALIQWFKSMLLSPKRIGRAPCRSSKPPE